MGKHNIDALVSSRICHDLISPVGAIGNGIELLEELADNMPEVALISESVENAKAKLLFFRICFGQSSDEAITSVAEIEGVATAMLESSRLDLAWELRSAAFLRERVKLLFLALLCAETALPVGGTITISEIENGFEIQASSPRVQLNDGWDFFSSDSEIPATPALVQFPLAKELAEQIGCSVRIETSDEQLKVLIQDQP